jgi:hypothetical protein
MRTSLVFSIGLALLAAACGDDGAGSPQLCQLACTRAAECRGGGDPVGCNRACGLDPAAPAPHLSPRYLDAVRRCLAAGPCDATGLVGPSDACAREAAYGLSPSKPAEELCRRAASAYRSCGVTSLNTITCLDDVKIYDDPTLRRALRCYDAPCAEHPDCVGYTLGYPLGIYY